MKNNSSGQIIIILLLLMLVALSVGLAVTQRSVSEVTTSTQTEQASRAYSAAEAGVEKVIQTGTPLTNYPLGNDATATVTSSGFLPQPGSTDALEYPPIGRETTAQFWLVDPAGSAPAYNKDRFDLYFGNDDTTADKPAVEISVVIKSTNSSNVTNYFSKRFYYDSDTPRTTGISGNNFNTVSIPCNGNQSVNTILAINSKFYCKQTIGPVKDPNDGSQNCANPPNTKCQLIMARVRLLYSTENHKVALAPLDGGLLPPQVQILNSTGTAGQSQKKLQVFKVKDVVPTWFDFAIFSVNEIRK